MPYYYKPSMLQVVLVVLGRSNNAGEDLGTMDDRQMNVRFSPAETLILWIS